MRLHILAAALLASATAGTAMAADLPARAPAVAPAPVFVGMNWSGFYVGAHAGGGWSDFRAVDAQPPVGGFFTPAGGLGAPFNLNGNGWLGGLQMGYLRQYGAFVTGLEISGSLADIKKNIISPYFPASDRQMGKVDSMASATLRLGYAFDKFLLYVKGGYAGGNVKFNARDLVAGQSYSQKGWQNGWTLGAGADYALSPNWVIGVEYNYADLGSKTRQGLRQPAAATEIFRTSVQVHTVALRLNYLFGSAPTAVVARY